MSEFLLKIEDLSVEYEVNKTVFKAVNHLNLSLREGESLGLVGETGAGKTTTALSVMGLVPDPPGRITSGRILYRGEDLLRKREKELRRLRGNEISMIFQDPMTSLNPVLTVGDQIMEVIELHDRKLSKAEATKKAQQMLEMVGIPANRYEDYPHQFSGGMKQRVIIAIALACAPNLIIADEPTTALDVTIQAQVLRLMANLKTELNTSMLLITHDLGIVAEACDSVAVMYAGTVVEYGPVETVYRNICHPYTIGLFGSLPSLDRDEKRLQPIAGMMPDPSELPEGCPFAPRCRYADEVCRKAFPPMEEVEPGHLTACFHRSGERREMV